MNGREKNVFETFFDEGASHRPAWVTKRSATWLEKELHFAKWTAGGIETLPTIRIGDGPRRTMWF